MNKPGYFDSSVIAPLYRPEALTEAAEVFERTVLDDRHYWQARTWLQKRTTGLRTLDALHLAIAAESDWPMITADKRLHNAATSLGCPSQLVHGNDEAD